MTPAQELVSAIESRGGRVTVEGENLVIEPTEIGLPILNSLRMYKPEIIALIQGRPTTDETLGTWLLDRCVFDDRCSSSTSGLYLDYARWCVARGGPVQISRESFRKALCSEGFTLNAADLWHGLILRDDMATVLGGCK